MCIKPVAEEQMENLNIGKKLDGAGVYQAENSTG
jgi:hypothetical protein